MNAEGYRLSVSPPLRLLLLHCNDRCYPDCCQGSAFTIDDLNVGNWFESQHTDRYEDLSREISQIIDSLKEVDRPVIFDIRDINSQWKVEKAIEFFSYLEEVVFNVFCQIASNRKP